jgi:hypothetical protein|tara:strand:- start:24489 stop:24725 length:237 start_codon:yes stop_codon:yes gene_type:complete
MLSDKCSARYDSISHFKNYCDSPLDPHKAEHSCHVPDGPNELTVEDQIDRVKAEVFSVSTRRCKGRVSIFCRIAAIAF